MTVKVRELWESLGGGNLHPAVQLLRAVGGAKIPLVDVLVYPDNPDVTVPALSSEDADRVRKGVKDLPQSWWFQFEDWLSWTTWKHERVGPPRLLEGYGTPPAAVVERFTREYGGPKCVTCTGKGTLFNRKTYVTTVCPTCDGSGMFVATAEVPVPP